MLFYFMCDNGVAPEGFTKYKFEFYPYISVQAGMYGVSSASSNKDLAFQVLSACYSDPKTASLLYWGYEDADEWNRRTQFFSSVELDPITGFLPELSDEEFDAILRYSRKMDDLRSSLVVQDGRGGWYANPNYLYQLGYFFDHPPDYGDVFEVMNEQLKEWLDNNLE